MTQENKTEAIIAEITREATDGNFYRFAGDQEKYMESVDNVGALELKLADVARQAALERSTAPADSPQPGDHAHNSPTL